MPRPSNQYPTSYSSRTNTDESRSVVLIYYPGTTEAQGKVKRQRLHKKNNKKKKKNKNKKNNNKSNKTNKTVNRNPSQKIRDTIQVSELSKQTPYISNTIAPPSRLQIKSPSDSSYLVSVRPSTHEASNFDNGVGPFERQTKIHSVVPRQSYSNTMYFPSQGLLRMPSKTDIQKDTHLQEDNYSTTPKENENEVDDGRVEFEAFLRRTQQQKSNRSSVLPRLKIAAQQNDFSQSDEDPQNVHEVIAENVKRFKLGRNNDGIPSPAEQKHEFEQMWRQFDDRRRAKHREKMQIKQAREAAALKRRMRKQMEEKELAETLALRKKQEEHEKQKRVVAEQKKIEEAQRYHREHEQDIGMIVRREMESLSPAELKLRNFL